jgi:hypothetical protein
MIKSLICFQGIFPYLKRTEFALRKGLNGCIVDVFVASISSSLINAFPKSILNMKTCLRDFSFIIEMYASKISDPIFCVTSDRSFKYFRLRAIIDGPYRRVIMCSSSWPFCTICNASIYVRSDSCI